MATAHAVNRDQLLHVPLFALRSFVVSRSVSGITPDVVRRMDYPQLLDAIDHLTEVTEIDIEDLYERHRYGQPLTFRILLLPPTARYPRDVGAFSQALSGYLATHAVTVRSRDPEDAADRETDEEVEWVQICDAEQFDNVVEVRLRYQVSYWYVDTTEFLTAGTRIRYGYVWVNADRGYAALVCVPESVGAILTAALSLLLHACPVPITLHREIADAIFPLDHALRVTHADPQTKVRHSLAGPVSALESYRAEILIRDTRFQRPGTIYHQEIDTHWSTSVSVTASKGAIRLTRILPTSIVRRWARARIADIVDATREHALLRAESTVRASPTLTHLSIPQEAKDYLAMIIDALVVHREQSITASDVGIDPRALLQTLVPRYLNPMIILPCPRCSDHELCGSCPECRGTDLVFREGQIHCRRCRANLMNGEQITLACIEDHVTSAPLADVLGFAPTMNLHRLVMNTLRRIGEVWDPQEEEFHIAVHTVHSVRKLERGVTNFVNGDMTTINAWVGRNAQGNAIGKGINTIGGPMRKDRNRATRDYDGRVGGDSFVVDIGDNNTNVAIGKDISQAAVTTTDLAAVRAAFARLREDVMAQAPPDKREQAAERVGELEEAVTSEKPDQVTISYIVRWFVKNVPELARGVVAVVTDPNVHKLIGEVSAPFSPQ